jgi:hypothetical protein
LLGIVLPSDAKDCSAATGKRPRPL